jgi:hypothetical protein
MPPAWGLFLFCAPHFLTLFIPTPYKGAYTGIKICKKNLRANKLTGILVANKTY